MEERLTFNTEYWLRLYADVLRRLERLGRGQNILGGPAHPTGA